MTQILAVTISAVLTGVALVHGYWGFGGVWPASSALQLARTVVGARGIERMPPPAACFSVAGAVLAIAVWPIVASGMLVVPISRWLVQFAGVGISLIFLLRGVAPYTKGWRRIWPEQPFARFDRQVYGPLCAAIGLGCAVLLAAGVRT